MTTFDLLLQQTINGLSLGAMYALLALGFTLVYGILELINRLGPLSPSALAKEAGLHPATLTGILDRLERGGWLHRERDPTIPAFVDPVVELAGGCHSRSSGAEGGQGRVEVDRGQGEFGLGQRGVQHKWADKLVVGCPQLSDER